MNLQSLENIDDSSKGPAAAGPFKEFDFREILNREFSRRQSRNSRYSLRAYARDLELAAPKLCQILKGSCGLSVTKGEVVAEKLGLSHQERKLFLNCLEAKFSRSPAAREKAREKMRVQSSQLEVSLEEFRLVADWYHLALLEVLKLNLPNPTAESMAALLDISLDKALDGLNRLEQLKIIAKSGSCWKVLQTSISTTTDIPSKEIQEHHRQVLLKSMSALDSIPTTERDFSTLFFAMKDSELPEAKAMLCEFMDKFETRFAHAVQAEDAYIFAMQLYPITRTSGLKTKLKKKVKTKTI